MAVMQFIKPSRLRALIREKLDKAGTCFTKRQDIDISSIVEDVCQTQERYINAANKAVNQSQCASAASQQNLNTIVHGRLERNLQPWLLAA